MLRPNTTSDGSMGAFMSADSEMVNAAIDHMSKMITDLEEQLEPLQSGNMHVGTKGPDAGLQWNDITDIQIAWLKNKIASLNNTIERLRGYLA